ncbi:MULTISPECIES: paraquat-inducible protein A [unclassified Acidovorax]|uniref:paraquat-inducible protein A n=1 Tax=unclassified Acidovorax TaxID=2684926 RepID=UPI001E549C7E|nr:MULTISPECIES: paraquat-inducible protein A [unclassified Acidovorax]
MARHPDNSGTLNMKTFTNLVACEHCDTIYARAPLAPGELARCGQCDAVLYRASRLDIDRWLALTVAAAVAFVIANVCPVVKISLQGLHSQATLWQSAAALAQGQAAPIAVPTAIAIIVIPFMQISLLLWVLGHARGGRRAPGFSLAMRMLVGLRPWSMVEVALLGILVSVIKLLSMVDVVPGAGIWATTALMILITLVANRDVHWLWDFTDSDRPRGKVAP